MQDISLQKTNSKNISKREEEVILNKLPLEDDIIPTIQYKDKNGNIKYKKAILFHATNNIFDDLKNNNYNYPLVENKEKIKIGNIVHTSFSGIDENDYMKMEPYSPLILILDPKDTKKISFSKNDVYSSSGEYDIKLKDIKNNHQDQNVKKLVSLDSTIDTSEEYMDDLLSKILSSEDNLENKVKKFLSFCKNNKINLNDEEKLNKLWHNAFYNVRIKNETNKKVYSINLEKDKRYLEYMDSINNSVNEGLVQETSYNDLDLKTEEYKKHINRFINVKDFYKISKPIQINKVPLSQLFPKEYKDIDKNKLSSNKNIYTFNNRLVADEDGNVLFKKRNEILLTTVKNDENSKRSISVKGIIFSKLTFDSNTSDDLTTNKRNYKWVEYNKIIQMLISKGLPYIMMINDGNIEPNVYFNGIAHDNDINGYEKLFNDKNNGKIIPVSLTDFYKKYISNFITDTAKTRHNSEKQDAEKAINNAIKLCTSLYKQIKNNNIKSTSIDTIINKCDEIIELITNKEDDIVKYFEDFKGQLLELAKGEKTNLSISMNFNSNIKKQQEIILNNIEKIKEIEYIIEYTNNVSSIEQLKQWEKKQNELIINDRQNKIINSINNQLKTTNDDNMVNIDELNTLLDNILNEKGYENNSTTKVFLLTNYSKEIEKALFIQKYEELFMNNDNNKEKVYKRTITELYQDYLQYSKKLKNNINTLQDIKCIDSIDTKDVRGRQQQYSINVVDKRNKNLKRIVKEKISKERERES